MKRTGKFLYWAPRILSIAFICFLTLFSLDVFELGMSAKDIAIGLLMHNIPSLIMIVILVIAWRIEIVGAVCFIGAGLLYSGSVLFDLVNGGESWSMKLITILIIAGPAFLVGILFWINWRNRKKYSMK